MKIVLKTWLLRNRISYNSDHKSRQPAFSPVCNYVNNNTVVIIKREDEHGIKWKLFKDMVHN